MGREVGKKAERKEKAEKVRRCREGGAKRRREIGKKRARQEEGCENGETGSLM